MNEPNLVLNPTCTKFHPIIVAQPKYNFNRLIMKYSVILSIFNLIELECTIKNDKIGSSVSRNQFTFYPAVRRPGEEGWGELTRQPGRM